MTKITTDAQALAVLDAEIKAIEDNGEYEAAAPLAEARAYLAARLASTSPAPDVQTLNEVLAEMRSSSTVFLGEVAHDAIKDWARRLSAPQPVVENAHDD